MRIQKTLARAPLGETGQRGPAEHERREQIIAAAGEHFRHYGYGKTTVADLGKAIGLSKAYIYKFFEFEAGDWRGRLRNVSGRDFRRRDGNCHGIQAGIR